MTLDKEKLQIAGRIYASRPSSSKLLFYDLHGGHGSEKVQVFCNFK